MTFSATPRQRSGIEYAAASKRISTVSSNVQRIMGPVSSLLIPWRVMAIRHPRWVMTSIRHAMCR